MPAPSEPPGAGQSNLVIWLKIVGLLGGIAAFGLLIFWLRRATLAL
jgi:hypothetical protein